MHDLATVAYRGRLVHGCEDDPFSGMSTEVQFEAI